MVVNLNARTPTERTYLDGGRVEQLVVRGKKLGADVARRVTTAGLDLTVDGVSELSLAVSDPDLELTEARLFEPGGEQRRGSTVYYGNGKHPLLFEVAAVEVSDGGSGPTLTVTARASGGQRMRRDKGPLIRKKITPTKFVGILADDADLKFVGQPSPVRATISRQTGKDGETSWDTAQRLAKELGYVCFEAAGVLYFGRPTWLIGRKDALALAIDHTRDGRVRGLPTCRRTGDDPKRVASVDVEVTPELGDDLRPGAVLVLGGVPTFNGRYLVTGVTIPLSSDGYVTVTAATPVNPKPEPPPKPKPKPKPGTTSGGSSDGDGSGPAPSGRGTASAFVAVALSQAGDTYIYGAEASGSDSNPNAFDCSELVEWACARVGVSFVDGSSAQIAACRSISVEQAIRTRGALLWHPGHIAISLGDGRTIEAANPSAGVTSYGASGRFQRGGLIPGLAY